MLLCRVVGYRPFIYTSFQDEQKPEYEPIWDDNRHNVSTQSYGVIRPMYLKFQPDNYGGNLPSEGFPQLNSTYSPAFTTRKIGTNPVQDRMNQTWSQPAMPSQTMSSPVKSTRRFTAAVEPSDHSYYGNSSYLSSAPMPPPPPAHVSFNSSLPPLVGNQEWRGYHWNNNNEHYHQQTDPVSRMLPYEETRQSRWSRRSEPESYSYHRKMMPADEREIRDHGFPQKPVLAPRQFGSPQINEQVSANMAINQGYPNSNKYSANLNRQDTTSEAEPPSINLDDSTDLQDCGGSQPVEEVAQIEPPPELQSSPRVPTPQPALQIVSSPISVPLTPTSPRPPPQLPPHLQETRSPQVMPPHLQQLHPVTMTSLDIENYLALGQQDVPDDTQDMQDSSNSPPEHVPDIHRSPIKRRINRPTIKPGRLRRGAPVKETTKTTSIYPDTLPGFDHPKEGISKCLMQLDHQDWEVTMQGLQSVVRLARHHQPQMMVHLHTLCVALAKHIRSLRSQVARAACQAAALLFVLLGRALENDVEDLASALFSRTADTNRFLRGDCNHALDCMAENTNAARCIPAILSKGAKHQNAVVRTAACRMLVEQCNRLGAERILALPRDIRDGILNAGAKLLTEGSLETRKYAQELFTVLSKDSRLPGILAEVIPNSVMRNISKTLNKLQTKKS